MHFVQLRDVCDLSMPHRQWLELEMSGPQLELSVPALELSMKRPKHRDGPEYGR